MEQNIHEEAANLPRPTEPITKNDIRHEANKRLSRINHEFVHGIDFLEKFPKSVSIFGSARAKENNAAYKQARRIGSRIVKDLGYAVVTGGGPGIMEAGSRGAHEANGRSLGLTIRLPMEQEINAYLTDRIDFYYFFSRKVILSFSAEAYLFFEGGFGTMDEFFEIVTPVSYTHL
ncbi:TPA: TIGR00730 family Rossman fold protein, partial [Candidatus Taylorbacteria bacterium]|nr:TIGR00730 family Rossman fold protein [Candidatus Taylorbacteria bacterium]